MLPHSAEHTTLFNQLAETVRTQGGTAALFATTAVDPTEELAILARFHSDRAREYDEFSERARGFFAEIDKETQLGKFTHAELEEIESDLEKLSSWLDKIKMREFFPDHRVHDALDTLEACRTASNAFAEQVYVHEGIAFFVEDDLGTMAK